MTIEIRSRQLRVTANFVAKQLEHPRLDCRLSCSRNDRPEHDSIFFDNSDRQSDDSSIRASQSDERNSLDNVCQVREFNLVLDERELDGPSI